MKSQTIIVALTTLIVVVRSSAIPNNDQSIFDEFFQLSGEEVSRNDYVGNHISGRSDLTSENALEEYLKSHEITFKLPVIGSTVTLGSRNLDNEELNFKLSFGSGREVEARKKSKIKKIFVPILIFIFLKAITLIPLALGILAIKSWNAIQLSFVSFVAALGMAVYKLCTKLADPHPQIIHNAWEPHYNQYAARSDDAQQLAYSAHAQN